MHRRTWQLAANFCALMALMSSPLAQAYQTVKVGPSGATVFANPQSDSATTGTLKAGQLVNIVDPPKAGFYRATAAGGISGWVQEDALVLPPHSLQANHVNGSPDQGTGQTGDAERNKFYLGALAGLGIAGGGSSMEFGADAGYKLSRQWGLGLYFEYLGLASATVAANGTSVGGASLLLFALELNYYIPPVEGLFVGAKAGFGIASAAATNVAVLPAGTTSPSTSAFGAALGGGYDYPILPMLSVGGEANFFFLTGGNATTVVDLLAAVKFNF